MNDGDWMEAALTDESVVAELLLRLKHFVGLAPTSVESGSRQRRAKQVLEEKGEPARDSPSTPLSWSGGGTTASDASDSTRAAKAPGVRSKNISVGESSKIKKQRRRKTYAELKEQENFLLKETDHRQMLELKSFTIDLKKQKAKNEQLRKVKLGGQSHQTKAAAQSVEINSVADQAHGQKADCGPSCPSPVAPTTITGSDAFAPHQASPEDSSKVQAVVIKEPKFLLPDLNQLPEEYFSD